MSAHFQDARWRSLSVFNAMQLSSYCQARGRYELAHELHGIGTEWYERNMISKSLPGEVNDHGKPISQFLEEYKRQLAEFPLLLDTRSRLLESLNGLAGGIDRDKLKTVVKHDGSTTFGVICNQLARGGWLRQEKTGKKYTIYPESTAPTSDELFVSKEILPPPESNDGGTDNAGASEMSDEIPEGYELFDSDPIVRKPMTPELQGILDDARAVGFEVWGDLDDAILS
jgi:hypothetical protein